MFKAIARWILRAEIADYRYTIQYTSAQRSLAMSDRNLFRRQLADLKRSDEVREQWERVVAQASASSMVHLRHRGVPELGVLDRTETGVLMREQMLTQALSGVINDLLSNTHTITETIVENFDPKTQYVRMTLQIPKGSYTIISKKPRDR